MLPEIGPKRLHYRGVRITPPRQADVHGRDRIKRHDCFGNRSGRIVTPSPFVTIDLTASPEVVRGVTDG